MLVALKSNALGRINAELPQDSEKYQERRLTDLLPQNDTKATTTDGRCSAEDHTYPEGGLRAWLVVLGSWLAAFSGMGLSNSMATIHAYVAANQLADYNEGAIGWIFSVYVFLCFFGGVYVGPLFDKYGPRWLVLAGTVCVVSALMLLSVCVEYWQFMLTFGILNGIGGSLLFTPSLAAIGHWFQRRRGLATGIASTGAAFSGVVYPLILRPLFEHVGWGWAIRTLGLISFVACGAANLLIRARLPPTPSSNIHPDFRMFRQLAFTLTTAGIFLLECALFIPLTYISSYAIRQGYSISFSYQLPTILNAASILGRVLAGWWGDHFGAFNSNILAVALSVIACLAVWLPAGSSTAGLVIFVVLFGFASGNNISISPVCVGKLCETQEYGRYYATAYTVTSIACLIGVPMAGELITATGGDYWGLIVFSGGLYVASFCALWFARVSLSGWRLLSRC